MFRPVNQVREVEIRDVVANDNIWVNFLYKISPGMEHLRFVAERENLRAEDMRTCVECKNVPNERL